MNYRPLHALFAAEVSGLDLAQAVTPAAVADLETALDRYAVLVFREQDLDETQQMAFTRALGPVDMGLLKVLQKKSRFSEPGMIDISNVDLNSQVRASDDPALMAMYANQLWHSDSSFKQPPAKYSLLFAQVVTDHGGETEFADMRAAYDALSASVKNEIDGLVAQHSAFHSRIQLGDQQYGADDLAKYPMVEWPLVRTHPGSGRKTLFIGAHATYILGMPIPQGRLLLAELHEHATQPEFVYRHSWRKGDLVIWDNRAALHRGRRYDLSKRRELRRSTVEDASS